MVKSFFSPWSLALASFFLLAFLFAFRQNIDYDMGYHLATGERILKDHAFPKTDLYTYTVPGHDYVDLHWLYQVACALLYRLGDFRLLSLAHLALMLLAFALTALRIRQANPSPWVAPLLLAPTLIAVELRFLDRPEVLSWSLLLATLMVLDLRLEKGRDLLFLLPLIQLFWVNIEGLFVLGWVAMGAYLLTNWFHYRRLDRSLLKWGLLSLAADLVNPYFLKGAAFPLVLFTRLQGSNIFKQYISEFQSPWTIHQDAVDPFLPALPIRTYQVFALILLLVIGLAWKERRVHEWVLTLAFFGLSVAAIRNVPLFFWVVLPVAAASLKDLAAFRPSLTRWDASLSAHKVLALSVSLVLLLTGARVATRAYYLSDRRVLKTGLGVDESRFPVEASRFMIEKGLTAPLVHDLSFGGWLDWKGPSKTFIDGRLEVMGEDLFTQYRDSFYPNGLRILTDHWGAQLVLLDPMMNGPWFSQMRGDSGWRLLYFDPGTALYARSGYASQVAPTSWEDTLKRWGLDPPPPDSIVIDLAKVHRSALADWIEGFWTPRNYPMHLFRLGAFAYAHGRLDLARSFWVEALRLTQGRYYEIFFNLGAAYEHGGAKDLARTCYQKVLDLDPGNAKAEAKLRQL